MRPMAPEKPSDLLAAIVVLTTSNGYAQLSASSYFEIRSEAAYLSQSCYSEVQSVKIRRSLTSRWAVYSLEHVETSTDCGLQSAYVYRRQCALENSRNKLLNLIGFFSSFGAALATPGVPVMGLELILWGFVVEDMGPDQGKRVLRRKYE